jgi:hypothetical protein
MIDHMRGTVLDHSKGSAAAESIVGPNQDVCLSDAKCSELVQDRLKGSASEHIFSEIS